MDRMEFIRNGGLSQQIRGHGKLRDDLRKTALLPDHRNDNYKGKDPFHRKITVSRFQVIALPRRNASTQQPENAMPSRFKKFLQI
jgi:hypothetical protein